MKRQLRALGTVLACLVFLAACGRKKQASFTSAEVAVEDGAPVLKLGISFDGAPPGDASACHIGVGSEALDKYFTVDCAELLKRPGAPEPGTRIDAVVPLPLKSSFVTGRISGLELFVNLFWGTDNGPVHQARAVLPIEELFKRRFSGAPQRRDPTQEMIDRAKLNLQGGTE